MTITTLEQLTEIPTWHTKKTPVVCVNVIQETHDVKTFQFEANEAQQFHFKPGQFVGIQLTIDGERHNRSYTIASSPSRPHLLELTIKKEKDGVVSPWLHKNMIKGATLELRGPAGRFNSFDLPSEKVLLISAGSGITPMMSMARFWNDSNPNKDIKFLIWVRSTDDIIFRRELGLMDHKSDTFNLEVVCTQPGLSENWLGRRGRINRTTLNDMVPDLNEREVFCCGPEGFMTQVKTCLEALGFNLDHYHDESFDPGGKKKAKLAAQTSLDVDASAIAQESKSEREFPPIYQLTLKKSGITLDLKPNDIVLEKIEEAGVDIQSSCRGGNCGACHVKKIAGETTTEVTDGLIDEWRENGHILTCTTRLTSNVELDI